MKTHILIRHHVDRITIHADTLGRLSALVALNPPEPRYPSTVPRDGGRGDSGSSTERHALNPDPTQRRIASALSDLALAEAALQRATHLVHELERPSEHNTPRTNTVPACEACNGPCIPRPRSTKGHGPLCWSCFESWSSTSHTWTAWLNRRMNRVEQESTSTNT